MIVEFAQLEAGKKYFHKDYGPCNFIAAHPHDGAYLIFERYLEEEDEFVFFGCERSYISEIVR